MKRIRNMLLLGLLAMGLSQSALSQCANGTVMVKGRIENLPASAQDVSVEVVVATFRGKFSRKTAAKAGQFTVDTSFDSESRPYFPLWGHGCSNRPKEVEVRLTVGGELRFVRHLAIDAEFEKQTPLIYRLNHEMLIDASKNR